MLQEAMDVLRRYPVRKSKKDKQSFRMDAADYFKTRGYACVEEKGGFGAVNLVAGDPERAKFLITAHYDTCARLPFPNFITPCNFWIYLAYQILLTGVLLFPFIAAELLLPLWIEDALLVLQLSMLILWVTLLLVFLGPANRNNENDNTSGVVTVLEIADQLPEHLREQVCFVLFDLEEAGLIGSSGYRSKHKKASNNQIVLNMDCVGEGNDILLFPTAKLRKDTPRMELLQMLNGETAGKKICLWEKSGSIYPSDQASFPYGLGICALKRGKVGLYMDRIHTNKDTVLEEENVNILRDAVIKYLGAAVQ